MVGERVQFDEETWQALEMLARDRTMSFQEIADEAFTDLLRKHDRPVDLKDALKRSVKKREAPRWPGQAAPTYRAGTAPLRMYAWRSVAAFPIASARQGAACVDARLYRPLRSGFAQGPAVRR